MDADEMFRRGVSDAERGEPNPFYYQHYYHYRRGVDRIRRRGVRPVLAIALLAAAIVAGAAALTLSQRPPPISASQPTPAVAAAAAAAPTRVTPRPTATSRPPTATPAPAGLRVGAMARVTNTGGRPLRGRSEPSLQAAVRAGFPEGEQVEILDGPVAADGYTWWQVRGPSGVGWSAQQSPEGDPWLTPE
jgi:hypothetical protein